MNREDSNRGQTTLDFAVGVSVFLVVVAFVLAFVPGMVQPFQASTQQETAAADRIAEQLAAGMLVEDPATPYVLDRGCVATFFALENSDGVVNDRDAYPDNDDNDGDPGTEVRDTMYDITSSDLYTSDCAFDVSDGVFERLAVDSDSLNFRISLVADLDGDGTQGVLCIDANDVGTDAPERLDPIVETDDPYAAGTNCDMTDDDFDLAFETGNEPPTDTSSVVVARRFVQFEGGFADGTDEATLVVEVW